ncbi:uncharacterized protein LOC116842158 [Odontomachus brunneus]|uniref:uncharacterized protein LOC116842158 n=1 Tax=Odontomachus brunneus TaxID=486640 RepID=UPI0013F1C9A5|nr:uncharacterized protein LOC116842158 [Odontomachus brunneus]
MTSPCQLFLQAELSISSHTAVDWINFCRELLAQWISNGEKQLGGPNIIVEIDEAKFGRRKYHRGRIISQWLFGAIERDTGRLFILPVNQRSSDVLIPIIRHRIAPGNIIHSDCWRAYNSLCNYSYIHNKVNHKENFVDPQTGVYTQNIERLWRDMRGGIPRYGIREKHYMYYIAEFVFKRKYEYHQRIDKFFEIMASLYPMED